MHELCLTGNLLCGETMLMDILPLALRLLEPALMLSICGVAMRGAGGGVRRLTVRTDGEYG